MRKALSNDTDDRYQNTGRQKNENLPMEVGHSAFH